MSDLALLISGGKVFIAEGTENSKTLTHKCYWYIPGITKEANVARGRIAGEGIREERVSYVGPYWAGKGLYLQEEDLWGFGEKQ